MRVILLFFSLTSLFVIYSCEKEDPQTQEGVILSLHNQLNQKIDTLQFWINTSTNPDSMLFVNIGPGEESATQSFDEVKYYFIEEGDIFIISKGFFYINEERYDLSNCFCDPALDQKLLQEGHYNIVVKEIDSQRNNVEYVIIKED